MRIDEFDWREQFVDKIIVKHNVYPDEVDNMNATDKANKQDPLPDEFETLEALGEFWDTHDSADYEEHIDAKPVKLELGSNLKRARYLPIEAELAQKLKAVAHRKGLSSETLLNLWIQEKLLATVN